MINFAMMLSLILFSCTIDQGDYATITNQYLNLENFEIEKKPITEKATGDSFYFSLWGWTFSSGQTLDEAFDQIFNENGGEVLKNVRIENKYITIPYFLWFIDWHVVAYVYELKK